MCNIFAYMIYTDIVLLKYVLGYSHLFICPHSMKWKSPLQFLLETLQNIYIQFFMLIKIVAFVIKKNVMLFWNWLMGRGWKIFEKHNQKSRFS